MSEKIQVDIPVGLQYADAITSKSIKSLVSVIDISGSGCTIIQVQVRDNGKTVRIYINATDTARNIIFQVWYVPT